MSLKYKNYQDDGEHGDGFESFGVDESMEREDSEKDFDSSDEEDLKPKEKVKEKDKWIPDEQLRLLYVYFKDMAVEPLFAAKQEVEISARIKMCEIRMAKVPKTIQKFQKIRTRKNSVRALAIARKIEVLRTMEKVYVDWALKFKAEIRKGQFEDLL